jgi:hypothetical protein
MEESDDEVDIARAGQAVAKFWKASVSANRFRE